MRYAKPVLLVCFFLVLLTGLVSAEQSGETFRFDNSQADTVFYCRSEVAVAPGIRIENTDFHEDSDGIKISITNYKAGEDTLFYAGTKFDANWNPSNGNLELTGVGTDIEYQEAVRNVFYENLSDNPATEPRSFSITLVDADYLPYTQHFYQYIALRGISWTEARDSATNMSLYGLQGYLATITSSIENDFIWTKIDGVGWIGANDAAVEGVWRWVTGPEAGTHFWQGTYGNGYRVGDRYSNWNNGEPNNVQKEWGDDEDYAHINADPYSVPKSWNDLPNEGDKHNPNGYYFPEGFVVEFGGLEEGSTDHLSASAVVAWSQKPEMELVDFSPLMCGVNTQMLDLKFKEQVTTELQPLGPDSQVDNETSLSPTISLPADKFGEYRFLVQITNRHQCAYSDTITVKYQHKPDANFEIDSATCSGYNLNVTFDGTIEGDARFDWYSSDTLFYTEMNTESLEIPLGYGQKGRSVKLIVDENGCLDSTWQAVSVTPVFDFRAENPEGCTPYAVQFDYYTPEPIETFLWDFGDGNTSSEEKPSHIFENYTTEDQLFDIGLTIVSADGCENSGSLKDLVTIHPIPSIDFSFSAENCYSATEEISYVGSAGENDTFLWDLTDFEEKEILENPAKTAGPFEIELLNRPMAEIGLQVVSEFGCETDTLLRTFKRKPVFSVSNDTIGGCPPLEANFQLTTTDLVDRVDYSWDFGNGETGTGTSVSQVYAEEDQHIDVSVAAYSSLTQCSETLLLPGKVFVYPVPQAAFAVNPPGALISDPVGNFENLSLDATLFEWDFDDGKVSSLEHPGHRFDEMGLYNVRLIAENDFGCRDSVFAEFPVAYDQVFPPTAFSPNAAKTEDREFRIYSEGIVNDGYKLLIFNRWGEVIFESESQDIGWDGKMRNGRYAPTGVYSWVLQYFDFLGNKHNQQGIVTLIF